MKKLSTIFKTMNKIEGTKENYTHIKFYYKKGHTMTLNKSTYIHYYPKESNNREVERIEYLIEELGDIIKP